jgi:hypothetical protein
LLRSTNNGKETEIICKRQAENFTKEIDDTVLA